jgi:tripartite-type tricarboxylate transporter receptor subunit TctC
LSGTIDVMFVNYSVVHSMVQAGKLRVLAIASERRIDALKAYPAAIELGVSGYVTGNWNGLMAPAGTSPAIVAKLNAIVVEGFRDQALIQRMTEMGMELVTGSPEEFAAHIHGETRQMKALLSAVKIQTE